MGGQLFKRPAASHEVTGIEIGAPNRRQTVGRGDICKGVLADMDSVRDSLCRWQMRLKRYTTTLAGGLMLAGTTVAAEPDADTCSLTFEGAQPILELPMAVTTQQQERGLQGVQNPSPGMVFLWSQPVEPAVWMKNTPAPLDAAFIDSHGTVIHTASMRPMTTTHHQAPAPVIAVLELPAGSLRALGVEVGHRVVETTCW